MLNFDLEYNDWGRIYFKQNIDPFIQGSCTPVMLARKQSLLPGSELTRLVSFLFLLNFVFSSLIKFLMVFTSLEERIPKESFLRSLSI